MESDIGLGTMFSHHQRGIPRLAYIFKYAQRMDPDLLARHLELTVRLR